MEPVPTASCSDRLGEGRWSQLKKKHELQQIEDELGDLWKERRRVREDILKLVLRTEAVEGFENYPGYAPWKKDRPHWL